ncbi:hypothetical protein ES707_18439 [subsurface metagenome]
MEIQSERVSGVNLVSLQPFHGNPSPSSTTAQELASLRKLSSSWKNLLWSSSSMWGYSEGMKGDSSILARRPRSWNAERSMGLRTLWRALT